MARDSGVEIAARGLADNPHCYSMTTKGLPILYILNPEATSGWGTSLTHSECIEEPSLTRLRVVGSHRPHPVAAPPVGYDRRRWRSGHNMPPRPAQPSIYDDEPPPKNPEKYSAAITERVRHQKMLTGVERGAGEDAE